MNIEKAVCDEESLKVTYEIQSRIKETTEEFILEIILPYCSQVEQRVVSKKKLISALEKAEKYKWHDLRKDPNDLPTEYKECLVFTGSSNLRAVYQGEDKWWLDYYDRTQTFPTDIFEAWKYTEPFESEVEE